MSLKTLNLKRHGNHILKDISGEFKAGKIIALLGPNGAGKSTLIQAMARLLACDGHIELQGRDIATYSSEQLAQKLAYLPQHSQLQFPLEVEEVLSLATLPFALTKLQQRQQVKQVIHEWGIESLAHKDFRQLSGGEQQRCQIARTYLQLSNMKSEGYGYGLWLLDEPSSSLDLQHQQQLQAVCRQAAEEGHCVVIVLHDLNQAIRLADEIWLLENGKLVAQGPAKEVMTEEVIKQVFKVAARRIKDADDHFFVFS
jgi:iron complex transport system ATP-binding protein|tara:strand:- start:30 stop:797 length:768 start_codon:yes stop_codon:yes gene_type:complete